MNLALRCIYYFFIFEGRIRSSKNIVHPDSNFREGYAILTALLIGYIEGWILGRES